MRDRRSRGTACGVTILVVLAALMALAAPAGAKSSKDPCKLLTNAEIGSAFGATVTGPQPSLKTPVSSGCEWTVAASSTQPQGKLSARLMTTGGKLAYDGLKTNPAYAPVAGLRNSLYQKQAGALSVLKGSTLVTVQGVFVSPTPPIGVVDVQAQLIPLMNDALKRA